MVSVYVYKSKLTRELVSQSGESVVNVLTSEHTEVAQICGTTSGREADKYSMGGLETRQGHKVDVRLVEGCVANLECKVVAEHQVGDHTLFVGEIVAAHEGTKVEPLERFGGGYADIVLKSSRSPQSDTV